MLAKVEPDSFQRGHVIVRMRDCIVVFDSSTEVPNKIPVCVQHETWTYNLWTEQWRKLITRNSQLPPIHCMCGVSIGSVIYMFGGGCSSLGCALWKATQSTNGSFEWDEVHVEKKEMPSRRKGHSCWEYGEKMWIFGGYGKSPAHYLNDHGDFAETIGNFGWNNQLLFYDPIKQMWKNVQCFGDVPSPREYASTARITDKVWLYGGVTIGQDDELYELNMHQLARTRIHTDVPKPQIFSESFQDPEIHPISLLVPVKANQFVLHGHSTKGKSTWILDTESYQWRQYPMGAKCYCIISWYTGAPGLNSDVIIFGIHNDTRCSKPVFSVMLEPKSLQQLAMRMIHQYRTSLLWTSLPPPLRRKLETE